MAIDSRPIGSAAAVNEFDLTRTLYRTVYIAHPRGISEPPAAPEGDGFQPSPKKTLRPRRFGVKVKFVKNTIDYRGWEIFWGRSLKCIVPNEREWCIWH